MKRLFVAVVALVALGVSSTSAWACCCKKRCNPCNTVAASNCGTTVAQASPAGQAAAPAPEYKEVEVVRRTPKWVEKEVEVDVRVPEWKDETRKYKVMVPKTVTETRDVTRCVTEWKDEVRERTVAVPVMKKEERIQNVCIPETKMEKRTWTVCVPKTVTETCYREKVTCRKVQTGTDCCGRPCYERVREVCQVPYTRCRRVYENETRTADVPVTTYRTEQKKVMVDVCNWENKVEKVNVKVPVMKNVTEKVNVNVCKWVEEEKTDTVKVCNWKTVKEKRKVQECTWVEEKVKEKVLVNAPNAATTVSCAKDCGRERRGCRLFRRNRDCGNVVAQAGCCN